MESQVEIVAQVVAEVQEASVVEVRSSGTAVLASGLFRAARIKNGDTYTGSFIQVGDCYQHVSKDTPFIRVFYPRSVVAIFKVETDSFRAVCFKSTETSLEVLWDWLRDQSILMDLDRALEQAPIRQSLLSLAPNIATTPIHQPDSWKEMIQLTGKSVGGALSFMGGFLKRQVNSLGGYLNEKMPSSNESPVSSETLQKLNSFKSQALTVLSVSTEMATNLLRPAVEKGAELKQKFMNEIDNSNNSNLKYAKELALTTVGAVNVAWQGLAEGTKEIASQLKDQGKMLVENKLKISSNPNGEAIPFHEVGSHSQDMSLSEHDGRQPLVSQVNKQQAQVSQEFISEKSSEKIPLL